MIIATHVCVCGGGGGEEGGKTGDCVAFDCQHSFAIDRLTNQSTTYAKSKFVSLSSSPLGKTSGSKEEINLSVAQRQGRGGKSEGRWMT